MSATLAFNLTMETEENNANAICIVSEKMQGQVKSVSFASNGTKFRW